MTISQTELDCALKELRSTVESVKKDCLDESKIRKINDYLDKQESVNQKRVLENAAQELKEKEINTRMDLLEKELSRSAATRTAHDDNQNLIAEKKAFVNWAKKGDFFLQPQELKLLRTSDDANGGYLIPPEYVQEIIKPIVEMSPIRSLARIRATSRNEVQIPTRTAQLSVNWVGEASSDSLSNSTYGLEKISVNKMAVTVATTYEALQDSVFNIESEIFADAREQFAVAEGIAFVSGTGTATQPQGIMTNTAISEENTGLATALTGDSIINLASNLKTGYNLTYLFNRKTTAKIRVLKDGEGQYLWLAGLANGTPATLNGLRYVEAIDMPDVAANTYPIILGDFSRGYTIVDNLAVQIIRDDVSSKRNGKIEFTFFKRVGAQVTLAEAFRKLKVAV
ncbi:MAG: hypothetical protein A2Y53_05705 [Chloroflexi bacterium RBG_16_47_49]|nr:MAG: hypothetical protein A2Y53_05705 [Chloroflexi bacterium RBG_16_47_49]